MTWNIPNILTLGRILLIPVLVLVYYLNLPSKHFIAAVIFVAAGMTDWLDGYLARRWNQQSSFGAFLDPVADKLMVAIALLLLATDPTVLSSVFSRMLFGLVTMVIIGREIVVSALREWMAELGQRATVAVNIVGKLKTALQFTAIALLLFRDVLFGVSAFKAGEIMLYVAAALTLWSMIVYLQAAWATLLKE